MNPPSVSDYLKYANLQMAAEAFLVDSNGKPLADIVEALRTGNGHASKFTQIQAVAFTNQIDGWTALDQRASTETGFSGTLFKNNKTGELVISFRSTEFIDDAVRDNLATNTQEIKNTGWAWGQIADMEEWYAELNKEGGPLAGKNFSVTGYSLGGHLATAFNLLRTEEEKEGIPYRINQVVTFNGAGVGKIKDDGTLKSALEYFTDLRSNPNAIVAELTDPALRDLYLTVQQKLSQKTDAWTIDQSKSFLNSYQLPDWAVHQETQKELLKQKDYIFSALDEIQTLKQEAERLTKVSASGVPLTKGPATVSTELIEAQKLDYRMAVKLAGRRTESASLFGGAQRALTGKEQLPGITNQYDVVGDTWPSAVANSLWHYGVDVRVFIEDQPLYRGGVAYDATADSLDYGSIKLLVNGYKDKDFGDTHSLVLIVDSLNVQNTLLQFLPADQRASAETAQTLKKIFQTASYLKAENGSLLSGNDQGKADGTVLENTVSALGNLLLGPEKYEAIIGNPNGNTWAEITDTYQGSTAYAGREKFYKTLAEIQNSTAYKGLKDLQGKLKLSPSSSALKEVAREDFAAFTAIYSLSPFYLGTVEGSSGSLEDVLGKAWESTYEDWKADRSLTEAERAEGKAKFSDVWLNDRSNFLGYWLTAGEKNVDTLTGVTVPGLADTSQLVFKDLASNQKITVMSELPNSGQPASEKESQYVIFGGKSVDVLEGGKLDDHLYGGIGTDYLDGKRGNDHLEGGKGLDLYSYTASSKDTPFGRVDANDGNDTIHDTDSLGVLRYTYTDISGKTQSTVIADASVKLSDTQWQSADGKFTYTKSGSALVIKVNGDARGGLTLKDFKDGSYGIHLWEEQSTPQTARTITGDRQPQDFDLEAEGIQSKQNELGNLIITDEAAPDRADTLYGGRPAAGSAENPNAAGDKIDGGGGNDTIFSDRPKGDFDNGLGDADWIIGGAGRDQIETGAGNDLVEAGEDGIWNDDAGGDVVNGGAGNDRLFAESQISIADAISQGNLNNPTNQKGDFLYGGTGDDWVIGGRGRDVLHGGQGKDLIVGGAGNDTIQADISWAAGTLNWGYTTELQYDEKGRLINSRRIVTGVVDLDPSEVENSGGDDVIYAGSGDDWAYGQGGNDFIDGGDGNDDLCGGAGLDTLLGRAGDDVLDGGAGSDNMSGAAGNDVFISGSGNDTLDGGAGNDTYRIEQGTGHDTIFDWDETPGNLDVIEFGSGLTPDNVIVSTDASGSLYLTFSNGADRISISGWFADNEAKVERVRFADGTEWDAAAISQRVVVAPATQYGDVISATSASEVINGLAGDDTIEGMEGNDLLFGGSGDDSLWDWQGSNVIDGGIGNDSINGDDRANFLIGGKGNDDVSSWGPYSVIGFNAGDGVDTIEVGNALTLSLGGGITLESLTMRLDDRDLIIIANGADSIRLADLLDADSPEERPSITLQIIDSDIRSYDLNATLRAFEQEVAAGGSRLDWSPAAALDDNLLSVSTDHAIGGNLAYRYATQGNFNGMSPDAVRTLLTDPDFGITAQLIQIDSEPDVIAGDSGDNELNGTDGDNTLFGGIGNDHLAGGQGDDTYVFNANNGIDYITDTSGSDTVQFGDGITSDSLSLGLGSLLVRYGSATDAIHIEGFNPDNVLESAVIENFRFADGTSLTYEQLVSRGFDLSGSGDISGTSVQDRITGSSGEDAIYGGAGDDHLSGGAGNDLLDGGAGDDQYLFRSGDGSDRIIDTQGNNTLRIGSGLTDADLHAERQGDDLVLTIVGTTDAVLLAGWFNSTDGVNHIVFDDGSQLDREGIELLLNRAPVATPDSVVAYEDGGISNIPITYLLDNDADPNPSDVLTVISVGDSQVGASVSLVDGMVQYDIGDRLQQLGEREELTDTFAYTVSDGQGAMSTSVVEVNIVGVNDAPLAIADTGQATEDGASPVVGNVLANDSDVDNGTVLQVLSLGSFSGIYGHLTLSQDGSYTYNLNSGAANFQALGEGEVVVDRFSYVVTDGIANVTSSLEITITGTNDAPVVTADIATAAEDLLISITGNVLANDVDVDVGATLRVSAAGTFVGTYGTLTLAEDGSYAYSLNNAAPGVQSLAQGQVAIDRFVYVATDGNVERSSVLEISIAGTNDTPVVTADVAQVVEDALVSTSGNVLANDSDVDAGSALKIVMPGTIVGVYGTLTLAHDGNYTYSLNSDALGVQSLAQGQFVAESFTYSATDGIAEITSVLNITITGTNDVPIVTADNTQITEDMATSVVGNVLVSDNDVDNGTVLQVASPGTINGIYGNLTLAQDGSYIYSLNSGSANVQALAQGEVVVDRFSYEATDGIANVASNLEVTITGSNDAPVVTADVTQVTEDVLVSTSGKVLANDSDVDNGSVLRVALPGIFAGSYGSLTLGADGSYTYSLNSSAPDVQSLAAGQVVVDRFSYAATDGIADVASMLDIAITGTNDAPIVSADTMRILEDVTSVSGNVLANDRDADAGAQLKVVAAGTLAGLYGDLTIAEDGSYTYLVNNAANMQAMGRRNAVVDRFTYTATDGIVEVASSVAITLQGTNDAPSLVTPLADQTVKFNKPFSWQMPEGSFIDGDRGDTLTYTATLADGSALPSWLRFDAATRTFSGVAPKAVGAIDIRVSATDQVAADGSTEGSLSTSDVFRLSVSHVNNGVGNGHAMPQHNPCDDGNDGPHSASGKHGSKVHRAPPQDDTDDGKAKDRQGDVKAHGVGHSEAKLGKQTVPAYLNSSQLEQYAASATTGIGNISSAQAFARWLAVDLAVSEALASEKSLSWLNDRLGADTSGLSKATVGYLGSATTFGGDAISLVAGTGKELKAFQGLGTGVAKIA